MTEEQATYLVPKDVLPDDDDSSGREITRTLNPLDVTGQVFKAGLRRRQSNRAALVETLKEIMTRGTDYGPIHVVKKSTCALGARCQNPNHFSKDQLFKPGAEKICSFLGITATFPNLPDYVDACLNGVDVNRVILRCELVDPSGSVVATGVGARSLEQDYGDMNKALKMAEKSAMIDATLRMAGLSELYGQDAEDMPPQTEDGEIDESAVPMGKHKGENWCDVSDDYIIWVVAGSKHKELARTALGIQAKREWERRGRPTRNNPNPTRSTPTQVNFDAEMSRKINQAETVDQIDELLNSMNAKDAARFAGIAGKRRELLIDKELGDELPF